MDRVLDPKIRALALMKAYADIVKSLSVKTNSTNSHVINYESGSQKQKKLLKTNTQNSESHRRSHLESHLKRMSNRI